LATRSDVAGCDGAGEVAGVATEADEDGVPSLSELA